MQPSNDTVRTLKRRQLLKTIGASTLSVAAIQPVAAGNRERYLVTAGSTIGLSKRIEGAGFEIVQEIPQANVLAVVGESKTRSDLEDVNGVNSVARDIRLRLNTAVEQTDLEESTDDELFPLQWDKRKIEVPEAHETATGEGAKIAIADLGLPMNDHPDFQNVNVHESRLVRDGQIRLGEGEVEFPAEIGNLCAGTTTRRDHVAADVAGHGSLVGGVAAANRSGTEGVVGVAPDADVVSIRAVYWEELDYDCDGDGEVEEGAATFLTTTLDAMLSLDYAAKIDADVVNVSGAWPLSPLPPRYNAGGIRSAWERVVRSVVRRGTVVVAAAGNNADDVGGNLQQGGRFMLPQSMSGALTVSATGPNDKLSYYSNYGTNVIDVAAPGGGYETEHKTFNAGPEQDEDRTDDPDKSGVEWPFPTNLILSVRDPESYFGQLEGGAMYSYSLGTSLSCPQVSGAVALIREVDPDATPQQVHQAIEYGAEGSAGKSSAKFGAGRLNVAKMLDAPALN